MDHTVYFPELTGFCEDPVRGDVSCNRDASIAKAPVEGEVKEDAFAVWLSEEVFCLLA